MKTKLSHWKKAPLAALTLALCAGLPVQAQQRTGGGGGGGGFGGFGGGGFGGGGNNFNRGNQGGSANGSSPYNNNGTVGGATISVDPETHNLIVIADEETSQQISNVIASLDSPKPQVLIKVVFVEVEHDDSSDIGFEGGWTHNGSSSLLGGSVTGNVANVFGLSGLNSLTTNFNSSGAASSFLTPNSVGGANGFYQLLGSDFQATLRAIATAGKSQILSRPSVLARDGQLAKIVVGQEVPLPTSVSYATSGNATIPIVNVTYTDVGIILNVTPFIGANGMVEMIVQPQTSAVNPTLSQTIAPGVSAPYLDMRSADTVVVTPDSQTVVIGGLISNTKSSSESKVPFLGDIPWLGNLFKSKTKSDDKTELLIFLTPHIVQAPTQLAALTASETRQTRAITNSVSEEELDRFLERVPVIKKH